MEYNFVSVGAGVGSDTQDPRNIYVSEDGLNWQTIKRAAGQVASSSTGEEIGFRDITHAKEYWFATSAATGITRFWRSRDLINWFPCFQENGDVLSPGNPSLEVFYAFNKYWISSGWYSDDGLSWEKVMLPPGFQATMAKSPGFIAFAKERRFIFTSDGINFTEKTIPFSSTTSGSVSGLSYSISGGFFTAVKEYDNISGTGVEAATTYDFGETWTVTDITNITSSIYYWPKHNLLSDGSLLWLGETVDENNNTTSVLVTSYDGIDFNSEPSPFGTTSPVPDIATVAYEPRVSNIDVILIVNAYGLAYGNSSIGQGNPWTLVDLGIDPSTDTSLIRDISHRYSSPVDRLSYITVGANNPVYTVAQESLIQATLRYQPPIQTEQEALTLYKVAKDYRYDKTGEIFPAMPQTDEGLPFYEDIYDPDDPNQTLFSTQPGNLPYRYETVEEWGKVAIFVNSEDVTFFRGAATVVETISWQTFGNFEAASLYFPAISQYDKLAETTPTDTSGTGGGILPNAIPWLTDDANIEIKRIKPDDTLETIWLGSVNGLDLDPSGIGMRITAHGLIYEANHQLLPGDLIDPKIVQPRDTGLVAAEVLNSIDGRWSYAQPINTGISTVKRPDWDNAIDFLRNLNSIGSPEIWIDTDYKPYVTGRSDIHPNREDNTFDIIAGQDGVELSLQYDSTAPTTVIYGNGSLASGTKWRNVFFPAVGSGGAPDFFQPFAYPFDFPEDKLKKGMAESDTASGTGVSILTSRLAIKGYLNLGYAVTSYFDDIVEAAVKQAQEDYGLDITGEVDPVLWSRLVDVGDIWDGAYIRPLYVSPLIDPSSPSYDPSVRRVEQYINFGSNIDRYDAADVAKKIIERDMIQYTKDNVSPTIYRQRKSVTGSITMTMDPIEYGNGDPASRWNLKPGDSIRIIPHIFAPIQDDKHDYSSNDTRWEADDSAGSLLLYIKRVEWKFDGTPTANLTVSTRDLEFNELDAAQARVRVSNAERIVDQKAKKASGKTAGS